MDAEQHLRRAVDRHTTERERAVRELADVDGRRDDAIRAAAAAGMTLRQIGAVAGISFQRVSQIVRDEQRTAA